MGETFIVLYTLAYMGTCLLFLAPLLVTLAVKVDSLVGIERALGGGYSLLYAVAGVCAVLAAVAILPVKGIR